MENKINELFSFVGSEADLKNNLSQHINIDTTCSNNMFNFIDENACLFSGDEWFVLKLDKGQNSKEKTRVKQFLPENASYHINAKKFTMALICLLIDIQITSGFATFLLGLYGIDYSVTKLESFEKCIAYKIKKERRLNFEQLKQLNLCDSTHFNKHCFNRTNDKTCQTWNDRKIRDTLNSLLTKKIIVEKDSFYEIIF